MSDAASTPARSPARTPGDAWHVRAEDGSVGLAVLAAIGVVVLAIGLGLGIGTAVAPDGLLGDWRTAYDERDPIAADDPDPDGFGDGETYGDDPELDELWDLCDGGDLDACDTLFLRSPFGSEYEQFGATCGGREGDDFFGACGEGGMAGGADRPDGYGDDPFLDELHDACEGGDLEACDTLFWGSPLDSAYEDFGATCGDRVEAGVGDCENRAG